MMACVARRSCASPSRADGRISDHYPRSLRSEAPATSPSPYATSAAHLGVGADPHLRLRGGPTCSFFSRAATHPGRRGPSAGKPSGIGPYRKHALIEIGITVGLAAAKRGAISRAPQSESSGWQLGERRNENAGETRGDHDDRGSRARKMLFSILASCRGSQDANCRAPFRPANRARRNRARQPPLVAVRQIPQRVADRLRSRRRAGCDRAARKTPSMLSRENPSALEIARHIAARVVENLAGAAVMGVPVARHHHRGPIGEPALRQNGRAQGVQTGRRTGLREPLSSPACHGPRTRASAESKRGDGEVACDARRNIAPVPSASLCRLGGPRCAGQDNIGMVGRFQFCFSIVLLCAPPISFRTPKSSSDRRCRCRPASILPRRTERPRSLRAKLS